MVLAQRERNIPVSGEIINQKALNLKSAMNIRNFNASDGWLQRFKTRYGIRFLKITAESYRLSPSLSIQSNKG